MKAFQKTSFPPISAGNMHEKQGYFYLHFSSLLLPAMANYEHYFSQSVLQKLLQREIHFRGSWGARAQAWTPGPGYCSEAGGMGGSPFSFSQANLADPALHLPPSAAPGSY